MKISNQKIRNWLNTLNLLKTENITLNEVKTAYKKICFVYHPDKATGSLKRVNLETMKAINVAFDGLKAAFKDHSISDYRPDYTSDQTEFCYNFAAELNKALAAIIDLDGVEIEMCGTWVYLTGNTEAHKKIIKAAGFRWAKHKKSWIFRPAEYKSFNRGKWDMEKIRENYGSELIKKATNKKSLNAA